ncbi:hypothetical protein GCM10007390_24290 [Persicitalea jodogahamensis]|uniref:Uncharacterized protein n=1 Tax=Persicitalea jodogahamensis TaxID=402147 RepID=A0A8J3DAS3_9BACT|nr:hypothetical protein GCM10007390_24290 [Persicitalea jodogahamensis]
MLKPFEAKCAEKGKALTDICIEEAYPGDVSTSLVRRSVPRRKVVRGLPKGDPAL